MDIISNMCCNHWECPYKCCIYHKNYDETSYKYTGWDQTYIDPHSCIKYMDI